MSKKVLILLIPLILISGAGLGYLFFNSQKTPKPKNTTVNSPTTKTQETQKFETPELTQTYEDEAGFSFMYPKATTAKDTTPDDEAYYTQVTVQKTTEKLVISAMDTKEKTLESWVKSSESPKGLTLEGATTLGKISASQYSSKEKLYTLALDKGVMYIVESPNDNGYWEALHNSLIASFSFAGQTKTTTATQVETTYEEEVVE